MNYKLYIITYEIHPKTFRKYENFYKKLKSFTPWMHYLENTWFIGTYLRPEDIYKKIAEHLYDGDKLFISRLTNDYYGLLPQEAWDWVKEHQSMIYTMPGYI